MEESRGEPTGGTTRVSDSPWFWVLLFTLFALAALTAIVPKHLQRQTRLERMNFARQVSRPGAADSGAAPPEVVATDLRKPPVLPLFVVLLSVAALAGVRLFFVLRSASATAGQAPLLEKVP